MAVEVILPRVDMDMQSGRISRWLVKEGDTVNPGDPLFEIETSKAAMEIEATGAGILNIVVDSEEHDIPVGSVIAYLLSAGEALPASSSHGAMTARQTIPEAPLAARPSLAAGVECISEAPVEDGRCLRATPLARRIARDKGLNLADIQGSGPRGRITSQDVRHHAGVPAERLLPRGEGLAIRRAGGETGTPVVFLHGFASEAQAWNALLTGIALRLGADCPPLLALDLPGHGASQDEGDAGIEALAEVIITTLLAEGASAVHLVGHSLGGALSARIADDGRINTASLVLLAPAGLGADVNAPVLEGILRARALESLRPWAEQLFADPARANAGLLRALIAQNAVPARHAYRQRLAATCFPDGTQSARLRWPTRAPTIPARIIWGRQDNIIPWRHALAAPSRFALHLLDGCGHMPHIEATDMVADLLTETLLSARGRVLR